MLQSLWRMEMCMSTAQRLSLPTCWLPAVWSTLLMRKHSFLVLLAHPDAYKNYRVLNPAAATATPAPSGSSTAPVFSGASSATEAPFTSGISASTTIAAAPTGAGGAGGAGGASSSSSSAGAAMVTGAVGMGALLGMGVWANL